MNHISELPQLMGRGIELPWDDLKVRVRVVAQTAPKRALWHLHACAADRDSPFSWEPLTHISDITLCSVCCQQITDPAIADQASQPMRRQLSRFVNAGTRYLGAQDRVEAAIRSTGASTWWHLGSLFSATAHAGDVAHSTETEHSGSTQLDNATTTLACRAEQALATTTRRLERDGVYETIERVAGAALAADMVRRDTDNRYSIQFGGAVMRGASFDEAKRSVLSDSALRRKMTRRVLDEAVSELIEQAEQLVDSLHGQESATVIRPAKFLGQGVGGDKLTAAIIYNIVRHGATEAQAQSTGVWAVPSIVAYWWGGHMTGYSRDASRWTGDKLCDVLGAAHSSDSAAIYETAARLWEDSRDHEVLGGEQLLANARAALL